MFTLEKTDGTRPSDWIGTPEELELYQLVVRSRESQSTASTELQRHDLSSFLPDLPLEISPRSSRSFRNQLAGCIFDNGLEQEVLYFSLNECGLITTHRFLYRNDQNHEVTHDPIHISHGVMYIRRSPREADPPAGQVTFASGSMMASMPPRTVGYDLKIRPLAKCDCGF